MKSRALCATSFLLSCLVRLDHHEVRDAAFIHEQKDRLIAGGCQRLPILLKVGYGLMVDFLNDHSLIETSFGCGAGFVNGSDDHAVNRSGELQLLRDARSEFLHLHSSQRAAALFTLRRTIRFGGRFWKFAKVTVTS